MTQDEIKKIAIEMVKKKHGNWYKMGDESEVYYGGIIDGINKVLNDPNAFANVIGSWVSVKDRLPELSQLCWVIYRATPNNRWYGLARFRHYGFDVKDVTHWMLPIPKPIDE